MGGRDWVGWHAGYDVAGSSLARRLQVVRGLLGRAREELREIGRWDSGLVVSICAGDGRDVLPLLAGRDGRAEGRRPGRTPAGDRPARGDGPRAVLIEFDPELADRARRAADELGLGGVEVRVADAGDRAAYDGVGRADLFLACGVFGNVGDDDVRRTVAALPALLTGGAIVVWTRGRGDDGRDRGHEVRAEFRRAGFEELAFEAPEDARFRVGMCRWVGRTGEGEELPEKLFTFR